MKISLNWINDYVDLKGVDYKELVSKIGLKTAEIEEVEEKGNISGVIVALIEKVENHPNSEKLHILTVNTGSEKLQIVCGAPNVRENMKVALAKVGANLFGNKIEVATIAGEVSYGMCCSKMELGIADDHTGIWEITDPIPLGTDICKAYEIKDTIFEVDNKSLTNRPDLWSHYGFAREISAITGRPLKPLLTENLQFYNQTNELNIVVNSPNCLRYSALKIGNINKNVSPVGMQIRLYYCGMRAINLLADLTNYLMLEVGQPMHAFDGESVKSISVKDVNEDTKFTTLDGQERILPKGTMTICLNNEISAVAGIMGGLDSEIKDNTRCVMLESACFDAGTIRKSAIKIGLRTEASARYEKSLDPEMTTIAIARFLFILRQIDPTISVQSALTDVYNKRYPLKTISTTLSFINKYIGVDIPAREVNRILNSLGFGVDISGDNVVVKVPTFRATKDISIPVDIVEEVARMYGYDNIEAKPVDGILEPVEQDEEHLMEYDAKLMLAEKFNLNEVHTYVWNDVKTNKELNINTKGYVKVLNSTVKDNDEIRSELTPSLIKVINDNKKYLNDMGVFEIARVCTGLDENNLCIERKHLSVVLCSETKSEEELYFEVKEIAESLANNLLNNQMELSPLGNEIDYVHPINNASLILNNKKIGFISLIHPKVLQKFDKKKKIAVLELDFNDFVKAKNGKSKVKEQTKYQKVSIDFNFLVDKGMYYSEICKVFNNFEYENEFEYSLIDEYNDESLGSKKSLTFNFVIYSYDHTLNSEEIENFREKILDFASSHNINLRME